MRTPMDDELTHWTTRITLRRTVQDAIKHMARENVRSTASMIGILLSEALSARSS